MAGWVLLAPNRPVLLVETYLWTLEPPTSRRNRALIDAAITVIRRVGLPHIWWGDFQCTPQELEAVPALVG